MINMQCLDLPRQVSHAFDIGPTALVCLFSAMHRSWSLSC